jgi:hypothetical protein
MVLALLQAKMPSRPFLLHSSLQDLKQQVCNFSATRPDLATGIALLIFCCCQIYIIRACLQSGRMEG